MRSRLLVLMSLAGCRLEFDPLPVSTVDAALTACEAERIDLGPWSTPVKLVGLNAGNEDDDPAPRPDGLELIWTSNRPGTLGNSDVWRATRPTLNDAWGPTEHVLELSTVANENTPAFSLDGLTLWFSSNRTGTAGGEDIFVTTRATLTDPWSAPVIVTELATDRDDRGPSLFDNDLGMVLHRADGGNDIYITRRTAIGAPWATPVLLDPPSGGPDELRPWMSPCGLELTFQSGQRGVGDMDFFRLTRASIDEPFGNEVAIDELNSLDYDQDLRITADRRHAYFSSLRGGGGGELYESTR